jgi:hypothetical protein
VEAFGKRFISYQILVGEKYRNDNTPAPNVSESNGLVGSLSNDLTLAM